MVDVAPFKALRLAGEKKNADISSFVCPPYDVISPEQRAAIVKRSPQNVVQIELPAGEGGQKYAAAAKTLAKWKEQEIVQSDRKASFYVLETAYRTDDPFAPKKTLKRYGVLAALRLETPGKGAVRPHERTLPKAKEDRLSLLSSVRTNVSPIFGLFFDEGKKWPAWIRKATKGTALCRAKENAHLEHRLWKVDDERTIAQFRDLLKGRELYIADGHHRYEVAWAYKDGRLKSEPEAPRSAAWNFVMTYVCPMEESGLLMLPTHRLVKTEKSFKEWKKRIESIFEAESVASVDDLVDRLRNAPAKDRVLGWTSSEGLFLLRLKETISVELCLSHRPAALHGLDVVLLHDLVLDEARGVQYVKDKTIFFVQDVHDMAKKAAADPTLTGFVLRSAGVESLARVAQAGEVMPPKTTYFYPKVPTGFALMPLDQKIV